MRSLTLDCRRGLSWLSPLILHPEPLPLLAGWSCGKGYRSQGYFSGCGPFYWLLPGQRGTWVPHLPVGRRIWRYEVGNEDGSWIMQLVTLVREQEMHSMKEGDPKDNNNSTEFEKPKDGVIKVSPGEIEQIFYAISTDMFCVNAIRKAYKLLSYEDRLEFDEAMVAGGQGNFLKKVKSVDYT